MKTVYVTSPQRDPHQEHEEDEEDIGDEVHRAQDSVGVVNCTVVKISKDYPELGETKRWDPGFTQSLANICSNPDPTPLS